jgi:hypothetical protein
MPAATPVLQKEARAPNLVAPSAIATLGPIGPHLVGPPPAAPAELLVSPPVQPRKATSFQPRVPVIIGEANYRGTLPVDGIICVNWALRVVR